jgi:hypothetical protein
MSLQNSIEHVEQLMHTLATADEIPNTFGMTANVEGGLKQILAQLPPDREDLDPDTAARLTRLATHIEDNRLLFGIPEQWLIDRVMTAAATLRRRAAR